MYFEDDDALFNPEFYQVVHRELYTIPFNLENTPYGLRSVPTHTEDGIPIRKLYVTNLPPKTTRSELFGVFAQYGFIRSCWLRMGDKGSNRSSAPTYAFVTFSDPADAHKALQAPYHEKNLRGRNLRISPADSWHQPVQDGEVKYHSHHKSNNIASGTINMTDDSQQYYIENYTNEQTGETSAPHSSSLSAEQDNIQTSSASDSDNNETYNMLQMLNRDCLHYIFSYIPVRDLIRSERVSKAWQSSIQEYLECVRLFKTSWWQHGDATLTTAVLRRVLQRLGGALLRLHIDHHWSALNDRTAHTVGKFCPALEDLKVVGMQTKNWNPAIYGCKNLKHVSFVSCNKMTDSSLVHIVKPDSCIESITVANNSHVTGLFLTGSSPSKLTSLSFHNCFSLQGTVLVAAMDSLPRLKCLRLDVCPVTMWKIIPLILKKLPRLEELSLSQYLSVEIYLNSNGGNNEFCEALATLSELKVLNLSQNIHINNAVLKQVAQSCPKLESLNISSCNSRKSTSNQLSPGAGGGVDDEGVAAVCGGCALLRRLDVSYLGALGDAGLAAAARLPRLAALVARGNPHLSAQPLAAALHACHQLQEVDACGCDSVTEEVVAAAARALATHPRPLALYLASTSAALAHSAGDEMDLPTHRLLTVNFYEDRSNPHLRPDFEDSLFDNNSDASLHEMYDPELEDFLGHDDDDDDDDDVLFLHDDDDDFDYESIYFGLSGAPIILL